MTTHLERQTERMNKLTRKHIEEVKARIRDNQRDLETLESLLLDKERAHHAHDNYGKEINNLDDREALLKFFDEQGIGHKEGEEDMLRGLFWDYTNVVVLCRWNGIECPRWFIDKYYK